MCLKWIEIFKDNNNLNDIYLIWMKWTKEIKNEILKLNGINWIEMNED